MSLLRRFLLVVLWLPSYFLLGSIDTWQLIINTVTTIVTFLSVALLQNTQERSGHALHAKLNAIAESMAQQMDDEQAVAGWHRPHPGALQLRRAVGLEERQSA